MITSRGRRVETLTSITLICACRGRRKFKSTSWFWQFPCNQGIKQNRVEQPRTKHCLEQDVCQKKKEIFGCMALCQGCCSNSLVSLLPRGGNMNLKRLHPPHPLRSCNRQVLHTPSAPIIHDNKLFVSCQNYSAINAMLFVIRANGQNQIESDPAQPFVKCSTCCY